jgi:hypothetical protein
MNENLVPWLRSGTPDYTDRGPDGAYLHEAVCPVCGDGIDHDANGYCGSCDWSPIPEEGAGRKESYSDTLRREGGMATSGKFKEADWQGVYPSMCVDPEMCRGYSHCPRPYSCSE